MPELSVKGFGEPIMIIGYEPTSATGVKSSSGLEPLLHEARG